MSHDDKPTRDKLPISTSSALNPEDVPGGTSVVGEAEALPDMEGAIRSGKLAGKSLKSAIWILAFPVLIHQTAAACLGLCDKIIAGNLPSDIVIPAMDGLGIGSYIGWFISIAMSGLGIGGQALIARAIGAGDRKETHHALGQATTLSLIWGILVGLFLWFIAPWLGRFCELTPEAMVYCIRYVRILACSLPLCAIMMVGSMSLHGAGETTKPAYIAVFLIVINILFSWALSGADITFGNWVLTNPFSFDMNVDGIALGTALSYVIGGVLILSLLRKGVKDLRLEVRELPLRRSMSWRIFRVGAPNFCEGISMWAVNLFVLMIIGDIAARTDSGAGLQGAHIIAVQWEMFSILPGFAIGTAAGALAGQFLGADNPRMAKRAVLICTGIACLFMGIVGVIYATCGQQMTLIISSEAIHQKHVPNLLFICGITQVFFAITMVFRQGLRGVGDTTWVFVITTVSSYGVRLPAAWFFGVHLEYGLEGVWIALCGELIVRAALFSARFFHGGWQNKKI